MTAIDASLPKKECILIAAEDVFSRRGYTKATLDEIIALADTGKGTLYKYFGNKDNLFYTLIEEKHSHLMDELHSLTAQQPDIRGKLQAYLNCMLKFLRTNKGLWLIVWYELNAAHQGIHPDFDENGNWTAIAQEMLAMSAIYAKNFEQAKELYARAAENPNAPDELKSRAQDMLLILDEEIK